MIGGFRISGIAARRRLNFHLQAMASSASAASTTAAAEAGTRKLTDDEWRKKLSPEEYHVLREKGTERPFRGEYDGFYPKPGDGYFECRACGNPLYSAAAKFKSGCGWPAFDKCYTNSVATNVDRSMGMERIEIVCAACEGHLGHVFKGERMTETNERHCVNSVSVKFVKGKQVSLEEEIVTEKI